jgi:hypothetical protein
MITPHVLCHTNAAWLRTAGIDTTVIAHEVARA